MQICILSVGTRGDVQPYIALGKGLQAAGHQVQLATLGMFEPMVRSYGLGFSLIEESPLSFIDRVIGSSGNFVQRLLETRRIITSMMERLLEDADLIIPSNLLDPQALVHLFRSGPSPFGQPWWLGAFCLLAPPLVEFRHF